MIGLSLIAIVYISLVTLVQTDMKKLIAYSSISHMGFVTLGCFMVFLTLFSSSNISDSALALEGAMVVMISHGLISGALFIGIGYIYERLHTREISDIQGIATSMPKFEAFFMLFSLANAGLPGTSGFVGKFMIILSAMKTHFWVAFTAASTLIFGAAYSLWMYKRVIFGKPCNDSIALLDDIKGVESAVFFLLAVCVLTIGIYPAILTELMHASISHLLQLIQMSKI